MARDIAPRRLRLRGLVCEASFARPTQLLGRRRIATYPARLRGLVGAASRENARFATCARRRVKRRPVGGAPACGLSTAKCFTGFRLAGYICRLQVGASPSRASQRSRGLRRAAGRPFVRRAALLAVDSSRIDALLNAPKPLLRLGAFSWREG